jgi:adenylosuccinate synthase
MVRQACAVSGVTGLALTKLDVLDGFDEIKVCTHYKLGDRIINHFPAGMTEQANVSPSTKPSRAGKARPAARAAGPNFPARP